MFFIIKITKNFYFIIDIEEIYYICMIYKKWRIEIKLTVNQIEIEYIRIFDQIELPKIYGQMTDKEYHAGTKNGVKYIKNIKAIVYSRIDKFI